MDYDEFLNVFLPAANLRLRDYILYGNKVPSYYISDARPLSIHVTSMAVRILEREKNLIHKRNEIRKELLKNIDFNKAKIFSDISRGKKTIEMHDLICYLEGNGFHARTPDLEAILRRCDHDADKALSFDEFIELTSIVNLDDEEDKIENIGPLKLELEKIVIQKSQAKRRNSND